MTKQGPTQANSTSFCRTEVYFIKSHLVVVKRIQPSQTAPGLENQKLLASDPNGAQVFRFNIRQVSSIQIVIKTTGMDADYDIDLTPNTKAKL